MAFETELPSPATVVEFHYKPQGAARPHDECENTDHLEWAPGSFVALPAVGDSVTYNSWEHTGPEVTDGKDVVVFRKVVSRHFTVHEDHIHVYLVVSDVSVEEMRSRLKE